MNPLIVYSLNIEETYSVNYEITSIHENLILSHVAYSFNILTQNSPGEVPRTFFGFKRLDLLVIKP